jgi:hypothetical protein
MVQWWLYERLQNNTMVNTICIYRTTINELENKMKRVQITETTQKVIEVPDGIVTNDEAIDYVRTLYDDETIVLYVGAAGVICDVNFEIIN